MDKLVVILGPTSSGKSALAIRLAGKFNGEIVSADSRQVYKDMDIGTGKVTEREQKLVPHHLLNVASPKKQFTVAQYKKLAVAAINRIRKKNRLPFLVGGSPFYIYATIDDLTIPEVKPNYKLRRALEKQTTKELFIILKNLDPKRARGIDQSNRARLVRAIEINVISGEPVPALEQKKTQTNILLIGIQKTPKHLRRLINERVDQRLKTGMVGEVKRLRREGLSFKKLERFGLEYRFISHYLRKKTTYEQTVEQLKKAIWQFSKRQMTWFKRDERIHWIQNQKQAVKQISKFLKN